ncbi:MFS transporter [Natrialbaceae archaeon A-CW2]|uniref:MFS transporter n=1 Tax=Natronosalvus amylolyticus TaxID=2961994 RepID=UPI0020C98D67|nr:MFS transporter [Natronosalvus amylolyticus]
MHARTKWLLAACCFVAGDAMAMQSRGALLSRFEADFGVTESLLGLVAPAGTVGFVVAIVLVGLLAGRLDVRRTMVVGAIAMATFLFTIALAPTYWLFLFALLAQGAAAGIFRAMDRPLLSHLYADRLGRVFVLYALAWALGAVTGPIIVSGVLLVASWEWVYVLIGLLFLPIVAVVWRSSPPSGWNEQPLERAALRELLSRPGIRGTLVGMALVGGIEGAIFTWLPYYALTIMDGAIAPLALSAYLLAYVPGRYLYARVIGSMPYLRLAILTTVLAVPALAAAVWTTSTVGLLVAAFLTGLLLSALFPLLSAYGVELAPAYSGPVSSLATAATYGGIAVVPTVMGVVAEGYSIDEAMWIPVGLAVLLVLVVWRMGTVSSGRDQSTA